MSLFYRIKVPLFEWKEQRWVAQQFYSDPDFQKLDQALIQGSNPYPQAHVFPYGETPLRVLYTMAKEMSLKSSDHFVDLGCGRGRAVFFLSHFFGCAATGVDLTPSFIARAKRLGKEKANFMCQDFLEFDFREATCVYLYGTTYSDTCLEKLEERLITLPEGGRVVTVSAPLQSLECYKELEVSFPWGRGSLFFHIKSGSRRQGGKLAFERNKGRGKDFE